MNENNFNCQKGLKLKSLEIEKFKLFENFNISFTDKNEDILPIIVLAGNNGTGKTTLFETIFSEYNQQLKQPTFGGIKQENEIYKNAKISHLLVFNGAENKIDGFLSNNEKFINNIVNLPFFECNINYNENKLKKIEKFIPFFVDKLIYEQNVLASVAYEKVENYIKTILEDLELDVSFSKLDASKQVYFKNKKGDEFKIDDLSSGEKTVFLKILFLYFADFKDSVILIDEPELSLHPLWQSRILKLYEKFALQNNCQIFIATHSPFIIGSSKPEYLRVLKIQENNIKVLDNFNKSYGLEFSKILLEVMGIKNLRVPEIDKKFKKIRQVIDHKDWNNFDKLFNELIDILGEEDTDLQLLKLEANLKRSKDA